MHFNHDNLSSMVCRRSFAAKANLLATANEQISQNPRRVAHCRVSSLVMVCRRSFAAKANLLAIKVAGIQISCYFNQHFLMFYKCNFQFVFIYL